MYAFLNIEFDIFACRPITKVAQRHNNFRYNWHIKRASALPILVGKILDYRFFIFFQNCNFSEQRTAELTTMETVISAKYHVDDHT